MPIRNDIFEALPEQILALRKALRLSRADLAYVLGMYFSPSRSDSYGVYRWEKGMCRPHPVFRYKMVAIVDRYRIEYLRALRRLQSAASTRHQFPR